MLFEPREARVPVQIERVEALVQAGSHALPVDLRRDAFVSRPAHDVASGADELGVGVRGAGLVEHRVDLRLELPLAERVVFDDHGVRSDLGRGAAQRPRTGREHLADALRAVEWLEPEPAAPDRRQLHELAEAAVGPPRHRPAAVHEVNRVLLRERARDLADANVVSHAREVLSVDQHAPAARHGEVVWLRGPAANSRRICCWSGL